MNRFTASDHILTDCLHIPSSHSVVPNSVACFWFLKSQFLLVVPVQLLRLSVFPPPLPANCPGSCIINGASYRVAAFQSELCSGPCRAVAVMAVPASDAAEPHGFHDRVWANGTGIEAFAFYYIVNIVAETALGLYYIPSKAAGHGSRRRLCSHARFPRQ